jgi:tetratricopeptide (TPR) repeat protein
MMTAIPRDEQLLSARRYRWLGEWNKAIQEYEALRMRYPDDVEVLEDLATSYRSAGQLNKAAQMLQEALEAC